MHAQLCTVNNNYEWDTFSTKTQCTYILVHTLIYIQFSVRVGKSATLLNVVGSALFIHFSSQKNMKAGRHYRTGGKIFAQKSLTLLKIVAQKKFDPPPPEQKINLL